MQPSANQPATEDGHEWPAVDAELLATLPPVLRAVLRALGWQRAREWLIDHGGLTTIIPKHHTRKLGLSDHELARLRIALAPHLDANDRVWLPKADKLFIRARDESIKRDKRTMSAATLARMHRLSDRQIRNIARETDDGQIGLF